MCYPLPSDKSYPNRPNHPNQDFKRLIMNKLNKKIICINSWVGWGRGLYGWELGQLGRLGSKNVPNVESKKTFF